MSGFASSIMLDDLNDFITPSQSCINPAFTSPDDDKQQIQSSSDYKGLPKIDLAIEQDSLAPLELQIPQVAVQQPDIIKATDNKTAQVSLSDCLACSGCVTSAETVLIEQQSLGEFLQQVEKQADYDLKVVTIATQSVASIAHEFDCNVEVTLTALKSFLMSIGIAMVLDLSTSGDISLLETTAEFMNRKRNPGTKRWTKPVESKAESKQKNVSFLRANQGTSNNEEFNRLPMPLITSECPGWICYVEKTFPETIPYITTCMSPQQISGVLVKTLLAKKLSILPARIYHATVMPCPDKKLEASRRDFFDEDAAKSDIDCVLTTTELLQLMRDKGVTTLQRLISETGSSNGIESGFDGSGLVTSHGGDGGSGGYLDFVFRAVAKEMYGVDIPPGPLPLKKGRNGDIATIELEVGGKRVLHFAKAYGFRNIQSIVRQLKRGKCSYDFIEIMACPGGCVNGGGQVRTADSSTKVTTGVEKAQKLANVLQLLNSSSVRQPNCNYAVEKIYSETIGDCCYSQRSRELFHTRYHAVPKLENPLAERW